MEAKKIFAGIFAIFLAFALLGGVSAQDESAEMEENKAEEMKAGTKPGSVMYGLDRAMENVRMAFTFNKEKRANYGLKIAEERIAEAKELAEENKTEQAEKAVENHEKVMRKIQGDIESIESNGDNETSEEALNKTLQFQKKFQEHRRKVAEVHNGVLQKMRNKSNMSEDQIKHLEGVFEKIENHSKAVEQKVMEKKQQSKMKYKAVSKKNDEEIEKKFGKAEKEINESEEEIEKVKERREEIREEIQERREEAREMAEEARERAREHMNESFGENLSEEARERAREMNKSLEEMNMSLGDNLSEEEREKIRDRVQEHMNESLEEAEENLTEGSGAEEEYESNETLDNVSEKGNKTY